MAEFQMQPDEKVVYTVRRHWLLFVGKLIPFAILDYIPYLIPKLGLFLSRIAPATGSVHTVDWAATVSFANPWVTFLVGIYWLFVWMGAMGVFIDYFLDHWIITNERIIEINQQGFWSREVSHVHLARVQDVESDISGFFQTLFGFGSVMVDSSGPQLGKLSMDGLARPQYIRDLIIRESDRARKEELSLRHD